MCPWCHNQGCNGYCVVVPGTAPTLPAAKPAAGPKVGELVPGRCKRCRGEALRVVKLSLDKLELFCKLCGKDQAIEPMNTERAKR